MNIPNICPRFKTSAAIGLGLSLAVSVVIAQEPRTARAHFIDSNGEPAGAATLTETPNGVLIEFELENLEPGDVHAFHIHQRGNCSAPDFESAGDHFDPDDDDHGFLHEDGFHAGDLPNLVAGEDGKVRGQLFNEEVTLERGSDSLLAGNGTALVLHASADDYRSQPAGDAGDRLLCAEIKPE